MNKVEANPYYKQKEQTRKIKLVCLLFFLFIKFRVMRLATLTVMSLHGKRYDMIALVIQNLAKPIITMRSIS